MKSTPSSLRSISSSGSISGSISSSTSFANLLGIVLLGLMMSVSTGTTTAVAAVLRAGVAQVDITPPLGIPLAGYYHERGADGVLDPLHSKALVIEQDGRRAALVVLDLISITRGVTEAARSEIEKACGIPAAFVMISATHAHTGPRLVETVTDTAGELAGSQKAAADYTSGLHRKIAESVRLACERLQPAALSIGSGHCENLSFNRRYFMQDGSVGWNPGKLNPNIVMPAGPIDPEVGIMLIEKEKPVGGSSPLQCLATYVNFAMHPDTTGGNKISADWPGALSRALAGYHSAEHITLLANGTCGNINHVDVSTARSASGTNEPNRIGVILGASVLQAYKSLKPCTPAGLAAKSMQVELALPEISPQQLEEARSVLASTKDDRGGNFMKLVRAHRAVDVAGRNGKTRAVEVQAMAMGADAAWVGLPGEVFVELGLSIKKLSPFKQTFIVELANDNIGYIPDHRSYAEGNYEPESARCAAGSGEKLVDAAVALLKSLHPSAAP